MDNILLSRRLIEVTAMVTPGNRFVDVGTDHGFVPIRLVKHNLSPGGLAMDVRPGPLKRACEHIEQYELQDCIKTRLSDGFSAYVPGEADSAIIAGMGGPLMIRILEEGMEKIRTLKELILSPQSEIPAFRRFLRQKGFAIQKEGMVFEEGKYYVIMKVVVCENCPSQEEAFTDFDYFGEYLLKKKDPVLLTYLNQENQKAEDVLRKLKQTLLYSEEEKRNRLQTRIQELESFCERIHQVKETYYEM